MRLTDENGNDAVIGRTYKDFRGDAHILEKIGEPHKQSSTGRVYTDQGEFFPSVIGLTWVEREGMCDEDS